MSSEPTRSHGWSGSPTPRVGACPYPPAPTAAGLWGGTLVEVFLKPNVSKLR